MFRLHKDHHHAVDTRIHLVTEITIMDPYLYDSSCCMKRELPKLSNKYYNLMYKIWLMYTYLRCIACNTDILVFVKMYCGVFPPCGNCWSAEPRNRHATEEEQVFLARCYVTHATGERVATPCPPCSLLRNTEVNTSLRQLVATQQ
jgi:hypothetical protein